MSESLEEILAKIPRRDNTNWMQQMLKEDIHDFIWAAGRFIVESGEISSLRKSWRRHFAEQAWWSLTCILYGHGSKNDE